MTDENERRIATCQYDLSVCASDLASLTTKSLTREEVLKKYEVKAEDKLGLLMLKFTLEQQLIEAAQSYASALNKLRDQETRE